MKWTPSRWIAVLALCQLAVTGVLIAPPVFTNNVTIPRDLGTPILALELARNVDEVDAILGDKPSPDRITMQMKTWVDFAFIACYGSLFCALSWMLRRRRKAIGAVALAFSAAAPVFDIVENVNILAVCGTRLSQLSQSTIDAMRYASYAKWFCAFAAMALLTLVYFAERRRLASVLGWLYAAMAATGLAGLAFQPGLINLAMLPVPAGLVGTAWLFWWRRDSAAAG